MAKRDKTATKVVKKEWFTILGPKALDNMVIGNIPLYEDEEFIGRKLHVNLMTITNDVKKQNVEVTFKIEKMEGKNILADFFSYEVLPSSIKRLVRKGRKRIDLSFVVKTKEGKFVRIKPFMVVRNSAKSSVIKGIRTRIISEVTKIAKTLDYPTFIEDMITYKLQSHLRSRCKKLFPILALEIKLAVLDTPKKYVEGQILEEAEEKEEDSEAEGKKPQAEKQEAVQETAENAAQE